MRQVLAAVSCALVLMVASSADAQSTFATLVGSIADSTGGVLSGATVATTNVTTLAVRTTPTGTVAKAFHAGDCAETAALHPASTLAPSASYRWPWRVA